jgi:hypothetical protein
MTWAIERANVDFGSVENVHIARSLHTAWAIASCGEFLEAAKAVPPIRIDFDCFDLDTDPYRFFLQPAWSVALDRSDPFHQLRVATWGDALLLSISLRVEVEIQEGVRKDEFERWLLDHAVWTYAVASGGWAYRSDEGGEFRLA